MTPVRVAVLAGGLSLEREVSLRSGGRVADALGDRGHSTELVDLDGALVSTLAAGGFDAAFLTLHGKAGEDGTIQGMLELLGLPYTGPDSIASAIAWDKVVFKGLLHRAGIHTPPWVALSSEAVRDLGAGQALDSVVDRLGLPLVVKPAQGGASMGVRTVERTVDLAGALLSSFNYHHMAVIERFVSGDEVAVTVVDGDPLPAVEIVPRVGTYDYAARYTHGATEFYAPARLSGEVLDAAATAAVGAYELAGCRHLTRADLIVDADGVPWVLELDTCPGMTETSLVPMAAEAAGWELPELCERVLALALASAGVTQS